jgi:putative FmdB family regulatory protein
MPVYEYACSACRHEFEEWQKITDEPVKVCPKCKKKKVERLISRTSFQLKGGGWYSDLYSSKGGGGDKASKPSDDVKVSPVDATPAKTESKPDSKPESKPDKASKAKATTGKSSASSK